MTQWRIEVNETVTQATVYIVEAESQKEAEELVQSDETEMELLSYYQEERKVNSILSAEIFWGDEL
jgi:hypothetical protein